MNWSVTYRGKDGKQSVEIIAAESRGAVFKAIADRGIGAICVEEAKGKAKPQTAVSGKSKRVVAALLAAICVAIGVVYILGGYKPSDKARSGNPRVTRNSTLREVKPQTNAIIDSASIAKRTDAPTEDEIPPHKKIVEVISVITNIDGSVLERFRTADGKIRSRQSAPKPIFDNASDQLLATAISGAASGAAMPPMPVMNNADEEFIKSLEREITINDEDSDEVKTLKKNVIAIREEIRQLMSEGTSFAEVIKDHRDIVNHGVEMREEAARMVKEFIDNGDRESAKECLKKVNEALAGMGIQGVEMPLTNEERRTLVRERRRNEKGSMQ